MWFVYCAIAWDFFMKQLYGIGCAIAVYVSVARGGHKEECSYVWDLSMSRLREKRSSFLDIENSKELKKTAKSLQQLSFEASKKYGILLDNVEKLPIIYSNPSVYQLHFFQNDFLIDSNRSAVFGKEGVFTKAVTVDEKYSENITLYLEKVILWRTWEKPQFCYCYFGKGLLLYANKVGVVQVIDLENKNKQVAQFKADEGFCSVYVDKFGNIVTKKVGSPGFKVWSLVDNVQHDIIVTEIQKIDAAIDVNDKSSRDDLLCRLQRVSELCAVLEDRLSITDGLISERLKIGLLLEKLA